MATRTHSRHRPASLGAFALGCALIMSPVSVIVAIAQSPTDAELVQRLEQLVMRKGTKDSALRPEICEKFGIPLATGRPREQSCLAYGVSFNDPDGFNFHSFTVFRPAGTEEVITIVSISNSRGGSFYRFGTNAKLEVVLNQLIQPGACCSWSRIPVGSSDAQNGRTSLLAYWRAKLPDLEKEPERPFTEDANVGASRRRPNN
jgi:hypothetical protein